MARIILLRHGHVEGISPERFRGQTDLPLTAEGRAEAAALGDRVSQAYRFEAIYCSPLSRCVDTAKAIAQKRENMTPISMAGITDISYGTWQGRAVEEIAIAHPREFRTWREKPDTLEFPEGESLRSLHRRVISCVKTLTARHHKSSFVMVGHDSVNRVLLLHVLGLALSRYWRISQSPCCINVIDQAADGYYIQCINDTGHLRPASA